MKPTTSKRAPARRSPSAARTPHKPCHPELAGHPELVEGRLRAADLPHDTVELSRALIGKLLVRVIDGEALVGRIVETEAYVPDDPASHAFRGRTRRNAAMFGPPLHAYVYFIYGTNWCLNITSEAEGIGAASLVRACEPVAGMATMRVLRGRPAVKERDLARGPGNLCRAFAIGPEFDGVDLAQDSALWVASDGVVLPVGISARIGITKSAEAPARFYAPGNPCVSGPRALSR